MSRLEPKVTIRGAIEFLKKCEEQVGSDAGLLMNIDGARYFNVAGIVSGQSPDGQKFAAVVTGEAQEYLKKMSGRPDKFDKN